MKNKAEILINNLTQDIIDLYDIKLPIHNIDSVVKKLGGSVVESTNLYESGIKKWNDGFIIYIPQFLSLERRKYAIAHEIGHLFLHMGYIINLELWSNQKNMAYYMSNYPLEEEQASEFASAFLMPTKEYKKVMKKYTAGNKVQTAKIAEYFGVSVAMASSRGKSLGILQTFNL